MTKGRPPNWNVFSTLDGGTWTEVVGITSKDRLSLPVAVRKRVSWLGAATPDGMLAILSPQGSAELIRWNDHGEKLIAQVSAQLLEAPKEHLGELALAAMDRFMRVTIDPPGRIGLPANLAAHIYSARFDGVRVVVRDDRLWLWSEAEWQRGRGARIARFTEGLSMGA